MLGLLLLGVGLPPSAKAEGGGFCPGEREQAVALRAKILKEWPVRPSADEATVFVQDLGSRLAASDAGRGAQVPWRFAVVRNLSPNAFSIGGGYVFVTEGAITLAESEDELAAILAHEIGHELAGHFCRDEAPAETGGFFDRVFGAGAAAQPAQETVAIGSLRQTVDDTKEQQADAIGAAILQAAGYDPAALLRLARRSPANGSTHLFNSNRIKSLERRLAGLAVSGKVRDSQDFQAVKTLLLGDSPKH